jgi:uncharacterized protein (DUF1810 family)
MTAHPEAILSSSGRSPRRCVLDLDKNSITVRLAVVKDPFDLQRFLNSQNPVYDQVCAELRAGQKKGHWMWFIFPQLRGLGHSAMAEAFGIVSRQEAAAYLDHAVLGPRLKECTRLVNVVEGRSIRQVLGYPDDLKFRSSMTLFASVTSDNQIFHDALSKYFGGKPDPLTLERL